MPPFRTTWPAWHKPWAETVLAEIDPAAFDANFNIACGNLSDRALLRALHFFGETRRARTLAEALRSGEYPPFWNR
jgi:hypothetical protein